MNAGIQVNMFDQVFSRQKLKLAVVMLLMPFTFSSIFIHAGQSNIPANEIRITAVGDIMLDGSARPELKKNGYAYAFSATRKLLQQSHIAIGNLEGPLTTRGQAESDKKYVFRSPPDKVAKALRSAGFNVVSLANNHSLDYGYQGMTDTMKTLSRYGIQYVGAGNTSREARAPAIVQVGKHKVAFLGYSLTFPESFWATRNKPGTAFGHETHITADVKAARHRADIVIVIFHWGQENKTELRKYQVQLGRAAIDAGAQAVIGHHPHILQAVERYKQGVILYSLGNYTFGSYSRNARVGAVAQLAFRDSRLTSVRLLPINVLNVDVLFRPQPLQGDAADRTVEHLQSLSAARNTSIQNRNGVAELDMHSGVVTTQTKVIVGEQ